MLDFEKHKRLRKNRFKVDLVAYRKAGKPELFGWVQSMPIIPAETKIVYASLEASRSKIPFAFQADAEQIQIYRKDPEGPVNLVWAAPPEDVLSLYAPDFVASRVAKSGGMRRSELGIIDVWLRDLIYHWKSEVPPVQEQMAAIGLLDRLEGGTVKLEVWLAGNPVY